MRLINISLAAVFTASLAVGAFANDNDQKKDSKPAESHHQDAPRSAAPQRSTFLSPRQSQSAQSFRSNNTSSSTSNRGWWNGNSSQQNHTTNSSSTSNLGYHRQETSGQGLGYRRRDTGVGSQTSSGLGTSNTFGNRHRDSSSGTQTGTGWQNTFGDRHRDSSSTTNTHGSNTTGQNTFGNRHRDNGTDTVTHTTDNSGQNTFGYRHRDNSSTTNTHGSNTTGQNTFGNRHRDNGTDTVTHSTDNSGQNTFGYRHRDNGNTFERRQDNQSSTGWWQGNGSSQDHQGWNQRRTEGQDVRTQHSDAFVHSTHQSFNFTHNVEGMHNRYGWDSAHHQVHVQHFLGKHTHDWRYGYFQREGFNESRFHFGLYVFSPFQENCVVSPWYSYPTLPAYLPESQVIINNSVACNWNEGALYFYYPNQRYDSYGIADLNYAIDDISQIFRNADQNAINDLIPSQGQIAIYQEGRYMYSVEGSDFQKMMQDNADNTQTTSFQISSVRVLDGQAIVQCRHTFEDPQNGSDTVYQEYRLRNEDGRYVVTDFMTSHSPVLNYHF